MAPPTYKDPFASSKSNSDGSEGTIYGTQIVKTSGNTSTTIGVNIQNPHKFYWYNFGDSSYGPCPNTTPYNNSWSAKNKDLQTANPTTDNIVVKTIYDPCPVGYTVAPANAFSTLTTKNWDGTNRGQTLGGLWFPCMGRRHCNSGDLTEVSSTGYYWEAVSNEIGNARHLLFGSGTPDPTRSYRRSYGISVRPVSEDVRTN